METYQPLTPEGYRTAQSETAKYRHLVQRWCREPGGLDIGSQGAVVFPWAISFDLPEAEFLKYSGGNPAKGPIDVRGFMNALPFDDKSLPWIYCVKPDGVVCTDKGTCKIDDIEVGDFVLGATGLVRVSRRYDSFYSGEIIAVESDQGVAEITANHPVATPLGWLDADELRESRKMIGVPPEVNFSHLVNSSNVRLAITRLAPPGPLISSGVSVSYSSAAKFINYIGLPAFSGKKWPNVLEQRDERGEISVHGNSIGCLTPRLDRLCGRHAMGKARRFKNTANSSENIQVAVSDLEGRAYSKGLAGYGGHGEPQAAFAIDNSSQVSPVSFLDVNHVCKYTYSGPVVNLETEDGTFFVNGILTHNCSHVIEDLDRREWIPLFRHWATKVKGGGHIVILVPEHKLWWAYVRRGGIHNHSHFQPEPSVGDIGTAAKAAGLTIDVEKLTECYPGDFTIMGVIRVP